MPYKHYTWSFIQFLQRNNLLSKYVMERNSDMEHKYNQFRKTFNGQKMSTHVHKTLFSDNDDYKLVPSNFPYAIDSNLTHLLLWFNPQSDHYDKCLDRDYVKGILDNLIDGEYIFYKNDIDVMSIKDMIHWHIFVKNS